MKKPNIVMIMTDQQRFDAIGCVNPLVLTPGIDSLAQNGILFDQAVCQCPMCVPSRNSMMFGLYASQTGVRTNTGALLDETRLPGVPLPQLLHDAGYFCAGFGKTHWNNCQKGEEGSRRGFDIRAEGQPRFSVLCEEGATMMDDEDPESLKLYFDETREFGSGEENALGYIGKLSNLPPERHRDGFIFKKCMEFLDTYESGEQPLFLYLSFIKPHAGFNIPPEIESLYDLSKIPPMPASIDEETCTHLSASMETCDALREIHLDRKKAFQHLSDVEKRRTILRYWANCTFMDSFIEKVLDKIRKKGLDQNTLFVFCSDHGEMLGERDYRFSKYCLYDSSVRVPFILAGDVIPKSLRGTRDHRNAMLTDLLPTLAAVSCANLDPRLPGKNLLDIWDRPGAFSEFHGCGLESPQIAPAWMWRTSEYKLILYRTGRVTDETALLGELYDLKKDPRELENVFDNPQYAEIRFTLMMNLLSHISTVFAKAPAYGDYSGQNKLRTIQQKS